MRNGDSNCGQVVGSRSSVLTSLLVVVGDDTPVYGWAGRSSRFVIRQRVVRGGGRHSEPAVARAGSASLACGVNSYLV